MVGFNLCEKLDNLIQKLENNINNKMFTPKDIIIKYAYLVTII